MTPAWARRVFYGWWIVGAGFGLEVLIGALVFHAYGAYVVLLREEFGWSRTLFSAAFAMARAESALLGPVQGWLTDRFGSRALMRVGMVVLGLGFILFSRIGSPVTFFVAFFLMAVGSSLGGYLPIAVAVVNWFQRRRALALGLTSSGSAVGGLLTPLVVASLTTFGWRGTALVSGVLVLLVGLPVAQVFRRRSAGSAELPDGLPHDDPGRTAGRGRDAARPRRAPVDFTARRGDPHRRVLAGLPRPRLGPARRVGGPGPHGHPRHRAARLLARPGGEGGGPAHRVARSPATSAAAGPGTAVRKRLIAAGCMVGHAAALLLLAMASAYWMVIAFAVLHGLAWGTRGPLMAAIRADYFGSAAFGTISGASSMVAMLGMMGGPAGGRHPRRPHGELPVRASSCWPSWPSWAPSTSCSPAARRHRRRGKGNAMRDYVARLEARGELRVVDREVDPRFELAAVTQRSQRESERPILFRRVKRTALPVVTNLYGSRRRLCELIGAGDGRFCRRWTESCGRPRSRPHGPSSPASGSRAGPALPQVTYCERDAAPYITAGVFLANEPETGVPNLSFHRAMHVSDTRAARASRRLARPDPVPGEGRGGAGRRWRRRS